MRPKLWFGFPFAVIVFAFSPALPAMLILALGGQASEANSIAGTLPWLLFLTVPIGAALLLAWAVAAIVKLVTWLLRKKD